MTNKVDIASIDVVAAANEGAEIELYHPETKEKIGTIITVVGTDSDVYQKAQRAQQNARLARAQKGRGGLKLKAEEIDAESLSLVAACVIDWRDMTIGGVDVPYSPQNVFDTLKRYPWIREQVDEAVGDRSTFLKASPQA